jgi:hypothetical protein
MDYSTLIKEIMESEDTVGADMICTDSCSLIFMAEGSSRAAYILNKMVIKIPTSIEGTIQSSCEFNIAGLDNEHGEYFLLPLLHYECGYLIQPLCAPIGFDRYFVTIFDWALCCGFDEEYVNKLREDVTTFAIKHDLVLSEIYKPESWGLNRLRLMLLDFGLTTPTYMEYYAGTTK